MSRFTTRIPATGSNGNIFFIVGTARRLMKELNLSPNEINNFTTRVNAAHSYKEACAIVEEYFPLDHDE